MLLLTLRETYTLNRLSSFQNRYATHSFRSTYRPEKRQQRIAFFVGGVCPNWTAVLATFTRVHLGHENHSHRITIIVTQSETAAALARPSKVRQLLTASNQSKAVIMLKKERHVQYRCYGRSVLPPQVAELQSVV